MFKVGDKVILTAYENGNYAALTWCQAYSPVEIINVFPNGELEVKWKPGHKSPRVSPHCFTALTPLTKVIYGID